MGLLSAISRPPTAQQEWEDQYGKFQSSDFHTIKAKQLELGVATCTFQDTGPEGAPDSNWAKFANTYNPKDPFLLRGNEFFTHYEKYIDTLAENNIHHFRFSIDWSLLQPNGPGTSLDVVQIEKHKKIIAYMRQKGITPHATLLHFNKPEWFAQLGEFEREENIRHFVQFSKLCVEAFPEIDHWYTINEPNVDSFLGYGVSKSPPNKGIFHNSYTKITGIAIAIATVAASIVVLTTLPISLVTVGIIAGLFVAITLVAFSVQFIVGLNRLATVLKNQLQAHCEVYDAIKTDRIMVSATHAAAKFEPKYRFDLVMRVVAAVLTRIFHGAAMEFYATGKYQFMGAKYTYSKGLAPMDGMGLQVYANVVLHWNGKPGAHTGQKFTAMQYPIYPESLYAAVKEFVRLRPDVPLEISENGAPADSVREEWIEKYLTVVDHLLEEGIDIQRFFYWTFIRNIEWSVDYEQHKKGQGNTSDSINFGLFRPIRDDEGEIVDPHLMPNPGARVFLTLAQEIAKSHPLAETA